MRIDSKEKITGVPILDVRKLLRSVGNEMEWGQTFVVKKLKMSPGKAGELLRELKRRGFIEPGTIIDQLVPALSALFANSDR